MEGWGWGGGRVDGSDESMGMYISWGDEDV
jgi:hypothetical protein